MKSLRTNALPEHGVAKGVVDAHIRKIERREWWLWTSAILVTLLLTLGIVSFLVPILHPQGRAPDSLPITNAIRGLVGMVLLFDIYTRSTNSFRYIVFAARWRSAKSSFASSRKTPPI